MLSASAKGHDVVQRALIERMSYDERTTTIVAHWMSSDQVYLILRRQVGEDSCLKSSTLGPCCLAFVTPAVTSTACLTHYLALVALVVASPRGFAFVALTVARMTLFTLVLVAVRGRAALVEFGDGFPLSTLCTDLVVSCGARRGPPSGLASLALAAKPISVALVLGELRDMLLLSTFRTNFPATRRSRRRSSNPMAKLASVVEPIRPRAILSELRDRLLFTATRADLPAIDGFRQ